ncbi:ABC transporter substrate-binding protein [Halopiger goleimassiliensis]|uniref:ABC transporter substrate-binding protein n=1 Tax=Halopiger goleimassiliensis TaxID=1293048 RepID=UPI0006781C52|nr:ABC transporter substrate-binding protein [Halopiger goleimassiliensis]
MVEGGRSISRRELLAGSGCVAASALAGCSERFWSRAEDTAPEQVTLNIKTVPTDDDAVAAKILSQLRGNMQAAGIDTMHEPVAKSELYRDVLLQGDYDVFVVRHQGIDEFDALRGLLHSTFVTESGWQNPFHFSDVQTDELLERQRSSTVDRESVLVDLFEHLEETAPYTVVAYPRLVGGKRSTIGPSFVPQRPIEYVELLSTEPEDGPRDDPLVVGIYGERSTDQLNPLAVANNRIEGVTGLLYDPLVRLNPDTDEYVPWLAESVAWDESDALTATVTLREGVSWHDGVDLDAADVAFTSAFLRDTSLGTVEDGVPAPRYRARQTLVESVEPIDDRTVEFSFPGIARPAARRVLTTPILPQHVWEPRSELVANRRTAALIEEIEEPVGSGLFYVDDVAPDALELEPFDDHPLRDPDADRPAVLEEFSQYAGLTFRIEPNAGAMIESLADEAIDVTGTDVPPEEVDAIREAEGVDLVTSRTRSFYMIGYNIHDPTLGNPQFRQILSRLIDREHVVSELLGGFGRVPETLSGLVGIAPESGGLDWESSIAEFPGSDGEIDPEQVRTLFKDAGYRYDDGELLE